MHFLLVIHLRNTWYEIGQTLLAPQHTVSDHSGYTVQQGSLEGFNFHRLAMFTILRV